MEAEKLAWQLSEQLCVDLVTINPSIIFGSVYMPKAHDKAFTFSVAVMQATPGPGCCLCHAGSCKTLKMWRGAELPRREGGLAY